MHLRSRRAAAVLVAVALAAAGCTASSGPFLDGSAAPSDGGAAPRSAACPAAYVQPDPNRPRITLTFDLADDLRTVRGTEKVEFTPDRPVDEVVFRLTANTAPSVADGNKIEVTAATAGPGGGERRFE